MARNQPPSAAEGSFVRLHAALIAMIAQVVGGVALAVVVALDLAIGWKVGAVVGYIAFGVVKAISLSNGRETRLYAEE